MKTTNEQIQKANEAARVSVGEWKTSVLVDDDGDPVPWRGDLHPSLAETCATPKCDNPPTEHGAFCDKHGGVIACSVGV